jgi:uncharacterized protein YaiI (UPF0178 family)
METDIKKIEKYASLFFTIEDISILTDIPVDELRQSILRMDERGRAYRKGTLTTQTALREENLKLAKKGDSDILTYINSLLIEQKRIENG